MGLLRVISNCLGGSSLTAFTKWLEPSRRADVLLRAVLTREQYRQLM